MHCTGTDHLILSKSLRDPSFSQLYGITILECPLSRGNSLSTKRSGRVSVSMSLAVGGQLEVVLGKKNKYRVGSRHRPDILQESAVRRRPTVAHGSLAGKTT